MLFEFDLMNSPHHQSRRERSQLDSNVRVIHVDEYLSFVYMMFNEDWIIATRMLSDTFQQILLDKQPTIDISTLDSFSSLFHLILFVSIEK